MMEHTENRSIEELKNENDVLREQVSLLTDLTRTEKYCTVYQVFSMHLTII